MQPDIETPGVTSRTLRSLRADTRGAGLVEYIILIGLIALAASAGFRIFGTAVNAKATGLGADVAALE